MQLSESNQRIMSV